MADLRLLVDKYLSAFMVDDAKFYAERLYYEHPSQENLYLLATCYHRQNKIKQCYLILQGSKLLANRHLLATCCFTLGKLDEAEHTLTNGVPPTLQTASKVPGGAMGLHLLGCICRRGHRKDPAIKYFTLSLQLDGTLWSSVTALCDLGVTLSLDPLFGTSLEAATQGLQSQSHQHGSMHGQGAAGQQNGSSLHDRHVAESGATGNTPQVALSLGLSSALYHVPLATPGSVPHMQSYDAHSGPGPQSFDATSFDAGHSGPARFPDYDGGLTGGSGITAVPMQPLGTNGTYDTVQTHPSSIGAMTGPRAALFDMSTPGLTPIGHQAMSVGSGTASYALAGLESAQSVQSTSHRHAQFTGNASSYAHEPGSAGGMNMSMPGAFPNVYEESAITMNMDGPPSGPISARGILQASSIRPAPDSHYLVRDGGHDGAFQHPQRRVSFGPTARLSFSGAAGEGFAEDADKDENPTKVQRMQELSGSGYPLTLGDVSPNRSYTGIAGARFDASNVSPIGHGQGTPYMHTAAAQQGKPPSYPQTAHAVTGSSPHGHTTQISQAEATHNASVLTIFAHAYQLLAQYQCRECVNLLHRLPGKHFSSGWVQQVLGRAYYEMNEYKPASLAFREMLRLEPFRVTGTEILSTTLWHMKREKELCALAQQVVEVDSMSPEAWCVVGNCLSLQREPEAAIKFFQRALQLDPVFTYAHTLAGHESVNNEDLDKAVQCFRQALLHNDRHYNAWYGLGSIYYRQERFELAEYHFRRALGINPSSAVLHCYLGMVLHAQGSEQKTHEALTVLTTACDADPHNPNPNPQLHFQRAHVLVSLDMLDEALEELETVRSQAPREPPVHVLMGQVLQRLGRMQEALMHFNAALDLDPKEAASLKSALESLEEPPLLPAHSSTRRS